MSTPAQMGSCTNKGLVCYKSSETGELWCARFREWRMRCPKDEEQEYNEGIESEGEDNE